MYVAEGGLVVVARDGGVRFYPAISGGGGGSAGSTKSTQQSQQVDPWLSKINELAYGQISKGIEQTGGLPAYLQPNPYALPNEAERSIVGQIGSEAQQWGNLTDLERAGLSGYEALADPTQAMSTAQGIYEKYAAPIVRNDATVRGQGRQGVVPESLASGFAQMALPIIQQAQGARGALAERQLGLGSELLNRRLTGLETSLRAAGAERQATGAEYMRPLQTIAGIVGGLPVGGGTVTGYATGKTSATRGDFDVLGDLIIPLVGAIAGGAASSGGCWLATAALEPGDAIRFKCYIMVRAPKWERTLYQAISRPSMVWAAGLVRPWLQARARAVL